MTVLRQQFTQGKGAVSKKEETSAKTAVKTASYEVFLSACSAIAKLDLQFQVCINAPINGMPHLPRYGVGGGEVGI